MNDNENTVFQHRFVWVNGIQLHVVQAGPERGIPVIFLHGFPEFWRGWHKQIGPLAQAGYQVIVPDQRGYNLSDKPKALSAYRMDVLARDVIGLMDALGLEKAGLVGHDWGGVIAWVTAALYPERVEKLSVLNAPYPLVVFRTLPRHPEQILRSGYMFFFQLDGLAEAVLRNRDWEALAGSMQRSSRPGTFDAEDLELYRRAWWQKGAMTGMLNWYRALFRRPLALPLRPWLNMPVLILWGVHDLALGREMAEASLNLCSHGRLVFFEEATHWVQHEEAGEVNRQLLDFFKE